jgi:hypothetical protein
VEDEAANLPHTQVVISQETLDRITKLLADKFRNLSGKDNVEAAVIDVPSHQMFRIRVERRAGIKDARTRIFNARGSFGVWRFLSRQNDCGGSISKESAGDKIGHRVVVFLPGKRTKLNRE